MRSSSTAWWVLIVFIAAHTASAQSGTELETLLKSSSPASLARKVERLGNAKRGARLFFTSPAACAKCHADGSSSNATDQNPLGPTLAKLGSDTTAEHVVESILYPSRKIRDGYAAIQVVTAAGQVVSGLVASQDEQQLVIRNLSDLGQETTVRREDIEEQTTSPTSVMPESLVTVLRDPREFYDLAKYIWEVARGGQQRADELRPSPEQLVVPDDTLELDHAGILKGLGTNDFEAGKRIYFGHCVNCHGENGDQPKLPTARAFGTQRLKYGADPLSMLRTLTRGNGLMGPMQHLAPKERYQVIHFIREAFMKDRNPDYAVIDENYLASLPRGTDIGEFQVGQSRDFGPVLASQLGSRVNSGLTFRLPSNITVNYDLHRFQLGGVWQGGFLDLSETQHYRQRGERMPQPDGQPLTGLDAYAWQLTDDFQLPTDVKPPRGPVDKGLAQFKGHYLYGDQAVLSYSIHGREVLETISGKLLDGIPVITHTLRIDPSERAIRLRVAASRQAPEYTRLSATATQTVALEALESLSAGEVLALSVPQASASTGERNANRSIHQLPAEQSRGLDLGTPERTVIVRFRSTGDGTLIASTPENGLWRPDGKSLFIRGGRLVFDIGWVGAIVGKSPVASDHWHTAALTVANDKTRLYLDGQLEGERAEFRRPVVADHVLKLGATATNFGGDFEGEIESAAIFDRVLTDAELKSISNFSDVLGTAPLWGWTKSENANGADASAQSPENDQDASVVANIVKSQSHLLRWSSSQANETLLEIPAHDGPIVLQIYRASLDRSQLKQLTDYAQLDSNAPTMDTAALRQGGPTRWPEKLAVDCELGESINGYALDSVGVPFKNPWNAWLRTSALDFLDDGRCVVTTHGGDVYLVDGLDQQLDRVTWKRYCSGLFEPFGVRVVNNQIYVTCRDGLKRLHDFNSDDEADFVEAFWNDDDVSSMFHAYNFDLQTDARGNFYFAKAGQYTQHHRPGTIMRVPPSGQTAEVVAWGLRTPNGMGKLFDDRFTVSDNQGPWMPAGKISLIRPGGFYGNMPINKDQDQWLRDKNGGELPTTFDEPFIWMPQELDNSCGGQTWAGDDRWGPLSGHLIHSSFGKGWLYYLSLQEIAGTMQAAIVPLPHQWDAGVMRIRVNPADGQLYGTGLSGWQGPAAGADGCLQRLRYTGQPARIVDRVEVVNGGIALQFNFPVSDTAADPAAWKAEMWDYLWSAKYGSEQYSILNRGEVGRDALQIKSVRISADRQHVTLTIPDLQACDQFWLQMEFADDLGDVFDEQLYMTIHQVPTSQE